MLVLEHDALSNQALSSDLIPPPCVHVQVFELHISEPREVSVITRMEEYRALRAANARFFGNPSQPVGHLEQEVMTGNRIYLQVYNASMLDLYDLMDLDLVGLG